MKGWMREMLSDIWFSFPVRLLLLHLRTHILLITIWVFLALLMMGTMGSHFGVRYLLLTPEYQGEVDGWSFGWLGFSFGWLLITWHLTCYLIHAYRFPFVASLSRPFSRFAVNNSLIPLFFLVLFFFYSARMQSRNELYSNVAIVGHFIAFAVGFFVLVLFSELFFVLVNVDVQYFERKGIRPKGARMPLAPGVGQDDIEEVKFGEFAIRTETYLGRWLSPKPVRSVAHYDSAYMLHIFRQNHRNAIIWITLGLMALLAAGLVADIKAVQLPAGASIFLLSGIVISISGAFIYWVHRWRYPVFIAFVLFVNWVSSLPNFELRSEAFGLKYTTQGAPYSYEAFESICAPHQIEADSQKMIAQLEAWKAQTGKTKPPLILLNASGGGLRAALWAMRAVSQADSVSGGDFFRHTVLLTGASGGMMGLAFAHELAYRKQMMDQLNLSQEAAYECISSDLLNSISYALVTNDLLAPISQVTVNGQRYNKDRGYCFEQQLSASTKGCFTQPFSVFSALEQEGKIPMLLLSPMVTDDSRRMLMASQGMSYMMRPMAKNQPFDYFEIDGIDFHRLLDQQGAKKLSVATALRMNATYPYILPNVVLPTVPRKAVMDAGFRDNFGTSLTLRFANYFSDWIKVNTSGVVLVQINGWDKLDPIEESRRGVLGQLLNPLGATMRSIEMQDFEQDAQISLLDEVLGPNMLQTIRFVYRPTSGADRASVTFHLTKREKNDILQAIYQPDNKQGLRRLQRLLE